MLNKLFQYLVLTIGSISLVCVLYEKEFLLLVALVSLSILMFGLKRSKSEIILFVICGLSGALAEVVVVSFGGWEYARADYLNVPIWLPILWGISAIYIKRLYYDINNFINKK